MQFSQPDPVTDLFARHDKMTGTQPGVQLAPFYSTSQLTHSSHMQDAAQTPKLPGKQNAAIWVLPGKQNTAIWVAGGAVCDNAVKWLHTQTLHPVPLNSKTQNKCKTRTKRKTPSVHCEVSVLVYWSPSSGKAELKDHMLVARASENEISSSKH